MTENTENLVLEHLRAISSGLSDLQDDMQEIKQRLGTVENQLVRIHADIAILHGRSGRIDRGLNESKNDLN